MSVLQQYSEGTLSEKDACRIGGYRDGAELMLALSEADLPFPRPPRHVIEEQAAGFVEIMRRVHGDRGEEKGGPADITP